MVRSVKPHYMSRFNQLLIEAAAAADQIDSHDLTSEPESIGEWAKLKIAQTDTALALVDHVVAHHRELYVAIQNLGGRDDSTEV